MLDTLFYQIILITVLSLSPMIFLLLFFISAPYGRHSRNGWGPTMPTRISWILMESPSVIGFAYFYWLGMNAWDWVPMLFFIMWQIHYLHRTVLFPFQIRAGKERPMAILIILMGFIFNLMNSFLNGTVLSHRGDFYSLSWLGDPRFLMGAALFIGGFVINRHADGILAHLRNPGELDYKIPQRGMFRWISSPNYFGEIVQWTGWAVATWSLAGLAFLLFTIANLAPRAWANHKWYHKQFEPYPSDRKALIPFLW
jgi:protein-S-isoprenylcysteine O-methyltransferase Ste14